jgi:hypothetical protein
VQRRVDGCRIRVQSCKGKLIGGSAGMHHHDSVVKLERGSRTRAREEVKK